MTDILPPVDDKACVRKIVVATRNAGKIPEIQAFLAPYGLQAVTMAELGLPSPAETGSSYVENATIKAMAAAKASGLPALADDSGVEVVALHNLPGIDTAPWTKAQGGDEAAIAKIEEMLEDCSAVAAKGRSARVVCALAVAWPDGDLITAEGCIHGVMQSPARVPNRGLQGMFIPEGTDISVAEVMLEETMKGPDGAASQSHRAIAFQKLLEAGLVEKFDLGVSEHDQRRNPSMAA